VIQSSARAIIVDGVIGAPSAGPRVQDLPHIRVVTDLLHHAAAEVTRDVEARLQDRS